MWDFYSPIRNLLLLVLVGSLVACTLLTFFATKALTPTPAPTEVRTTVIINGDTLYDATNSGAVTVRYASTDGGDGDEYCDCE